MMWKEKIGSLVEDRTFYPPTQREHIKRAEKALNILLPQELTALLLESNGVRWNYGTPLIWTIEKIESTNPSFRSNQKFRKLYMPFDSLLFFSDSGNGDQFAFSILDGVIRSTNVFVWNHENDSRSWVAPSLLKYVEWTISGKIEV